jgi:nuclear transport factor 2 (NTF2) superfamily protein
VYSKILTEYDSEGNVVGLKQYNEAGKMIYQGKMDKYGNHLADVGYNPDGSIHDKITAQYKYDEFGNEIEELLYFTENSPAVKSTYKYVYDMDGNWIRKTVWEDGAPVRITEREIDYF